MKKRWVSLLRVLVTAGALAFLAWTMAEIPSQAWFTELTHNTHERAKIITFRTVSALLGALAFAAAPLLPIFSTTEMTPEEVHQLADFATDLKIDLTVVGPELPLTLGLVDEFENRGLKVFGPRRRAAELEGSKVFAKEFMQRHGIPTAAFTLAHDADEARSAAGGGA